jgi:hypothetical protein
MIRFKPREFSCPHVFLRVFFPRWSTYYATMFNDELSWIVTFRGKKYFLGWNLRKPITSVVHAFNAQLAIYSNDPTIQVLPQIGEKVVYLVPSFFISWHKFHKGFSNFIPIEPRRYLVVLSSSILYCKRDWGLRLGVLGYCHFRVVCVCVCVCRPLSNQAWLWAKNKDLEL